MSAQPCRTARPISLSPDQALQIRKLIALHGEQGAMAILHCGVAVLDALRSGVAQPKTVARIAARLEQLRGGE